MSANNGRKTGGTGIRFPAELHEALRQAAEECDVSINWLVNKAVADFLPRLIPGRRTHLDAAMNVVCTACHDHLEDATPADVHAFMRDHFDCVPATVVDVERETAWCN